jgi:MFS transporter, FHS family, L-fucose permease
LLYLVYVISFFCGMTQCFESVFLPEFKEYFHLSYQQQMYTVFAKNVPFLFALAVGLLVQRLGYKNCLALAMTFYSAGTLLLVPGLRLHHYLLLLTGFLIIGTGFAIHMVAGNPLLSALGPAERTSSRLNLGNALGAIAQIVAPAGLTLIVPASVTLMQDKLPYIEALFLVLGLGLVGFAAVTVTMKDVPQRDDASILPIIGAAEIQRSVFRNPKVVLGFIVIFLVLGAETGFFAFFRNYMESPDIVGLTARESQRLFTVYFALFAVGRMFASWIQRRVLPIVHLRVHLVGALVCLPLIVVSKGIVAVTAMLTMGFIVSIFFPTLYAIAMENLGCLTPQASGLLTLGFLGCAVMPVLQGRLADSVGLQRSFCLGVIAYSGGLAYSLHNWQNGRSREV